ncbi:MAG: SRPBCC family protein [Coprobacillus sp.]
MHTVSFKETFEGSLENVWDLISNLNHQLWRSHIKEIKIIDETHFIEYDKDGYETNFTITKKIDKEIYEFDIENKNINGHWIGRLKEVDNQHVCVEFTEMINVNNKIMNLMAKSYLKKQQKLYIEDLKKALQR